MDNIKTYDEVNDLVSNFMHSKLLPDNIIEAVELLPEAWANLPNISKNKEKLTIVSKIKLAHKYYELQRIVSYVNFIDQQLLDDIINIQQQYSEIIKYLTIALRYISIIDANKFYDGSYKGPKH